jgi:NADH dehydrogenase/putative oxidoreductase
MDRPTTGHAEAASRAWADVCTAYAASVRFLQRGAGPAVDLAVRCWLAQLFFVSAVLKLADWDTALYLAQHEYPLSWLSPLASARLGVTVELLGAIALAIGLGTRAGALALLALAVVIQTSYRALDAHLFWIALCGWTVVRGAGPISLDHVLARGLADSALPGAGRIAAALSSLTTHAAPGYSLLLRAWAGGTLLLAAAGGADEAWSLALPVVSAAAWATPAQALLALLLVFGIATRASALGLIALSGALHMMHGGYDAHGYWLMVLALLASHGAGPLGFDAWFERRLRQRYPQLDGRPAFALDGLPRVVVVGAGFGGLRCVAALARARVAVTLVDRHNYHLFQPLLYQVATASLAPGDIATPIRGLFRDAFNVRVMLGEVTGVDTARRQVLLGERRLPYDHLVLATGAGHSYFGRDEWAPYAPGLKRIEDATEIRRRLLGAFERAEVTDDDLERQALLTFVIVGGGPTGVELAGALAELARCGMHKEFRRFDPASARVVLVQAAARLLPTFPPALSQETERALARLGVEVRLDSRVEAIDERGVTIAGARIAARTVLWAAGVMASPAARWLGAEADAAGRVKVGADLSVPGLPNVFVIGDTALSKAWKGDAVPGLAPAAKQGGEYVARLIRARVEGRRLPGAFTYRHMGSLATIGRKAAVVDFGGFSLRGSLAWWFWGALHVGFLVGLRNRVSVMFDWLWAYLTFSGGTRLITGGSAPAALAAPAEPRPAEPRRADLRPAEAA